MFTDPTGGNSDNPQEEGDGSGDGGSGDNSQQNQSNGDQQTRTVDSSDNSSQEMSENGGE